MSERQRGLGRGLSALLGDNPDTGEAASPDLETKSAATSSPIDRLVRNPKNPRKVFTEAEIAELAESIREKGLIQPILVRRSPDNGMEWQIVAGERRWRAAQKAGLRVVPIVVRDLDDQEAMEIAIIENVQREDLNPVEEARGYQVLMEAHGRTQDAVAGVVGKSRSHVANTVRLLALPEPVLDHLQAGRLSAGHARALITAKNPEALAEKIVAEGLNVRQTEILTRNPDKALSKEKKVREISPDSAALEQDLADALGLKVELKDREGKGELVLRYATLEQLDEVCRRLMRS